MKILLAFILLLIPYVSKASVINSPPPEHNELPQTSNYVIETPRFRVLTAAGINLIIEYEGYVTIPEAPDARYSGISWGIGYDAHQNAPSIIRSDWKDLKDGYPSRLAETHPYYGRSAQRHVHEVRDIRIPRAIGMEVFNTVDAARTYELCKKFMPGFENLRQSAKDALISLVFNRGISTTGDSRREMRELPNLVAKKDYKGIARNIRHSERVWKGTSIEKGMIRRREAEARMVENDY